MTNKKFKIKVAWGMDREKENIEEYSFDTQSELNAFTLGIYEGNGWQDYEFIGENQNFETVEEWEKEYHNE
tara:strand:+ start:71 stop:283 length:213 start_codon:yes stop_codon:yes gene_type:complete